MQVRPAIFFNADNRVWTYVTTHGGSRAVLRLQIYGIKPEKRDLVSNAGQRYKKTANRHRQTMRYNPAAQRFITGPNPGGYTVYTIQIHTRAGTRSTPYKSTPGT